MKLTVVKISKYRERNGQCLKQGISDIEFDFFWDAAFHFHERRKCSFTAKILQRKTKLQISEKYISIRTDAKKSECNFFCIFTASLKNSAREKPEMVWEEALILNSCCLPTNCSVLLLERQETRDDETSLGEKRKAVLGFSIGGNLVPGIIVLVTASSYITQVSSWDF